MDPSLRLATEEEKRARDRVTYAAWGEGLSLRQYLDREQQLRAHAWARDAMETWLLCDRETIVCSCESLRMPSWCGWRERTA